MKLFATSLLVAYAITFISASTCQSPIVSNGQCIGLIGKKFEDVDCSLIYATALLINAEGKLCFTGSNPEICLTRRNGRRRKPGFRMSSELKREMAFVTFNYDAVNNQLKVTAPNDQENKYPKFKDGKLKLSGSAEDVGCTVAETAVPTTAVPTTAVPTTAVPTTAVPTTAVPTTANPNIRTVSITSRVTIQQISNNELRVMGTTNGKTGVFIEKNCDYFNIQIIRYVNYNSIGWSIKNDALFTSWTDGQKLGNRPNGIGNFSQKVPSTKKLIYNNLNGQGYTTSTVDRRHNDGETIKISKTDTVIEFRRNGVVYYTYTFQADDRKDLYPALDIFYNGDDYTITF